MSEKFDPKDLIKKVTGEKEKLLKPKDIDSLIDRRKETAQAIDSENNEARRSVARLIKYCEKGSEDYTIAELDKVFKKHPKLKLEDLAKIKIQALIEEIEKELEETPSGLGLAVEVPLQSRMTALKNLNSHYHF